MIQTEIIKIRLQKQKRKQTQEEKWKDQNNSEIIINFLKYPVIGYNCNPAEMIKDRKSQMPIFSYLSSENSGIKYTKILVIKNK